MASQLSRNSSDTLVIVVKIYTEKQISKFPGIVQFCLIFSLTSKYFAQDGKCLLFLGMHCKYE